jgi:hypothetical protein
VQPVKREPLYGIAWTDTGLDVIPAAELARRTSLLKKKHAESILSALTKDPVAVVIREFGPGVEA